MSDTRPAGSRLSVLERSENLQIVIPGRGRLGLLFLGFFSVWLFVWNAAALAIALSLLPVAPDIPRGWHMWSAVLVGDVIVLPIFFWYLAGREIVLLDDRSLTIRREVFGIGSSRTYPRDRISLPCAHVDESDDEGVGLTFEFEGRRRWFGRSLTGSEVTYLIEIIWPWFDVRRA